MADVKSCDRCGKVSNSGHAIRTYRGISVHFNRTVTDWEPIWGDYDLCPECFHELCGWLKGREIEGAE